jgi:tetratricopeptide (TPR) repeat protein
VALYSLGSALHAKGQLDEAIAKYREALGTKQDFPEACKAHNNLGVALYFKGQIDDAIAEFRQAIRIKKDDAFPHNNLGEALRDKGQLDEAIAEFREAIRLEKDYAEAHCNLGVALQAKGQTDDAIAALREAIRIKKDDPEIHYALGDALRAKGQLDEAIAAFREAIRFKKVYAEPHCGLGRALMQKAQFREALEELRRGHELGSRTPGWRYPSVQWVRQCERLIELDGKLPEILQGNTKPASPAERIECAELCSRKRLHRAAARFYEEAFTKQPKLADDLDAFNRYNAACAAALAGCGQGQDAGALPDKEALRLRRQALDWLRAELQAWGRRLDQEPDKVRPIFVGIMQHWLWNADFAGVRGAEALARLPAAEREPWQKLWSDVTDLLARAQATTLQKKSDSR